ncbi:MAG TPA: Gfo/Idh/MocA family oxidoreductase, partial [Spirochaetota bacterium]
MKKYNWGILGPGWIAGKMAEAMPFVPNANLYAVASRTKAKADDFAGVYSIPKSYGSYEELVKDPDVDVVYVATPHNMHYEHALLALEHGKNVLCEKPFAVNGREVREMIAKAKEKNVFLMEALWSRFLPNVIKAKELVDSGAIGKVKLLDADFGLKVPFDPKHRLFNKELIGGSLLDLGI